MLSLQFYTSSNSDRTIILGALVRVAEEQILMVRIVDLIIAVFIISFRPQTCRILAYKLCALEHPRFHSLPLLLFFRSKLILRDLLGAY